MNLYVYCEGQTEFRFIKDVLYPYFLNSGVYAIPLLWGLSHPGWAKLEVASKEHNIPEE